MKEGLLDEKGKPNEKTPADWRTRYQELTHYGPKSTGTTGDGGSSVVPPQQDGQGQEEGKQHKKKKKKSRDEERESE